MQLDLFNPKWKNTVDHPWLQNAKHAPDVPLGDAVRSRLKQFSAMNKLKKKALRVSYKICRFSELLFYFKVMCTFIMINTCV